MSFTVAANATTAVVSNLNQFQTTLSGSTIVSQPSILGTTTVEPLQVNMDPPDGSNARQGALGLVGSASYWVLGYGTISGAGYLQLGPGTGTTRLQATSGGLQITNAFSVAGASSVGGSLSATSLSLSGNLTVSGTTLNGGSASGSSFDATGITGTGVWYGPSTNWALRLFDDAGVNTFWGPTALTTNAGHGLKITTDNGTSNPLAATIDPAGPVTLNQGINFFANGVSRLTFPSGSGGGTFSHGLGAVPSFVSGTMYGTNTNGCNCSNWFGNSSTFQVTVSGAWKAVAWVY